MNLPNDSHTIKIGDTVSVSFHNAQFTLCYGAKVAYMPLSVGESWIFISLLTNQVHYVSEPCTVSKLESAT